MSRSIVRPAAVLLAGALLAAGCSAGSTASPGGAAPGDPDAPLRIGLTAEPANLDFTRTDGAAIPEALLVNVYEGLVTLNQANGDIEPALAETWTVSPDGLVYDFTLREGVTFSNGEAFTADDVKFSIERVLSEDEWTVSLKDGMSVVSGVEVVSPTQARVTLSEPSNSWLFRMTTRIGAMFDPSGVADLANTPVGTGPYAVSEFRRGDALVLAARDDYWGERPAIGEVVLQYFDDATAATNALLTDGIDVIGTVQAPEALAQFDGDDRFQVIEGTTNGEVTLAMNNAFGPTSDPRVRRAIAMAIDHEAVLNTAWAGRGTLIDTMVPPTDPWYQPLPDVTPYDPAAARALLAEAGTPNVSLRFRVANLPYAVAAAQVVQSQLAAVGIDAQIEPLEFPARWLEQVFTSADYDLSIVSHVEPRDIRTFGNPDYYWRYDNPEVQRLLAESEVGTEEQQVTALQQVGRLIAEDAAADWLFLLPNLIVADTDVQGLPQNRIGEALDLTALSRV